MERRKLLCVEPEHVKLWLYSLKNQGAWQTVNFCNNINVLNPVTKINGLITTLTFTRIVKTKLYTLRIAWDIINHKT